MPDLQQFILNKSKHVSKYVYVFHALVSTHQQYRNHAFDHYYTIFCCGPHHEKELVEAEQLDQLQPKEKIHYGYPLLSSLKESKTFTTGGPKKILIAPSWYEQGIFQTCILEIVNVLKGTSYEIIIRPHPEFIKRSTKTFNKLKEVCNQSANINLDTNPDLATSMMMADFLITDRSGIAFEFVFSKNLPVIFIDTALKIQNPDYNRFKNLPVENTFRDQIGICVSLSEINTLPHVIKDAENKKEFFEKKIKKVRSQILYEEGSEKNGIEYIMQNIF
jgi:YidC/Oxa1 family membrane protein insertase